MKTIILFALTMLLASCSEANNIVEQQQSDQTLRVVSWNIRHGRGNDGNIDLERTAAVLRNLSPDIVALQEVDDLTTRSNSVAQADSLGKLLNMQSLFISFFDYQEGKYGMALLSKLPIASLTSFPLPDGNEPRQALIASVVTPGNDTVNVINVHFDWVENDTLRFAQASALANGIANLATPIILMGDFNDVRESRTMGLFLPDALESPRPVKDSSTFPSDNPEREIDFVLGIPHSAWHVDSGTVVEESMASDHRPVLSIFRIKQ